MNARWHERNPMPPKATLEERADWPSLRALLSGGDRRSQAQAKRALAIVRADQQRMSELARLADDDDWLVSMRALDLLEKLAHERPEWVAPYKRLFIGKLADSDKWEIRLQIVRALPVFIDAEGSSAAASGGSSMMTWTPSERRRAVAILHRDVGYPQTFVKAWALDSLATFAQHDASLVPIVRRHLRRFERSGSKALAARAGHIRRRLGR